jgi:ribosomal protein S18 acetylase RimI-like enzyme
MGLTFRKPVLKDKNKIEKFLILLKNDYIPPFSDEERREEINKIYKGNSKAILALTQKGQIVGYVAWEQYSKNKKYGYIVNLGVHPEYRRKGISIKLRKIVFGQIKKAGFKGVYYTTWHKNIGMIESSKKLGMKIVKVFLDEKFRGPGGKTIIFRKDF